MPLSSCSNLSGTGFLIPILTEVLLLVLNGSYIHFSGSFLDSSLNFSRPMQLWFSGSLCFPQNCSPQNLHLNGSLSLALQYAHLPIVKLFPPSFKHFVFKTKVLCRSLYARVLFFSSYDHIFNSALPFHVP